MKSYEIIIALVLVFMCVIIVTNLFSVERPNLSITEKNATQNPFGETTCYLTVSAKVTNLGGAAKDVIVRANVMGQTGNVLATGELKAGDLDKNQYSIASGEIEVDKSCAIISEVSLSIKSFS
jgi:flagellar basal body-associated protein FliL